MSSERELRDKKSVDYKKLHEGADAFDIETELTPVKTKKKGDRQELTSSKKKGDQQELVKASIEDSDDPVGDSASGADDTDEEESDEEVRKLEMELKRVKEERKQLQKQKKKEKLKKELEEQKKELQKEKEKEKGDVVKSKKKKKDMDDLTIDNLRKDVDVKVKAKSKVKKILELDSSDSTSDTSSSDDSSSSSSDEHDKKCKKRKSKSKKKSGIYDRPSDEVVKKQFWPQSKLQFEYAGSKMKFEDLEFNLFVAGELEIISSSKIDEKEKKGRIKLLKKIAYYFELYEWRGIKKLYAHIIRQIENGVADWAHDFSEVETPLLIKYVKGDQKGKYEQKKNVKRDDPVFYCSFFQRNKCSQSSSHHGKIKGVDRYLQHICATCYRKEGKKLSHPECSDACPLQRV